MVNMIYAETPWRDAFEKNPDGHGIIPQNILQQYYSQNRVAPWD
jgi:hypothetical protein